MSENQGNGVSETEVLVGGADPAQTTKTSGAEKSQTVTAQEFQSLKSQFETLAKEASAKDRKITELQNATKSVEEQKVTTDSLNKELLNVKKQYVRSEFARKNGVSDEALSYLKGDSPEELAESYQSFSALLKGEVDRHLQDNRQKLATIPAGSAKSEADRIAEIFASSAK